MKYRAVHAQGIQVAGVSTGQYSNVIIGLGTEFFPGLVICSDPALKTRVGEGCSLAVELNIYI